jgi:hypothetical protein
LAGSAQALTIEPRMLVARLGRSGNAGANVIDGVVSLPVTIVVEIGGAVSGTRRDAAGRGGSSIGYLAGGRVRFTSEAPAALDHIVGGR